MPVEYQDSTTFPQPWPFWWHDRLLKLEPLGEGKSQRARLLDIGFVDWIRRWRMVRSRLGPPCSLVSV
jgi:hypothetical protein